MKEPQNYREPKGRMKKFCENYCTDIEFFGNGVQSYIAAYNTDPEKEFNYNTARTQASKHLTNPNVLYYIDKLLESDTMNDQFADKQIRFLMTQNADFGSKLGAIKEYNALKKRITQKTEKTIIVTADDARRSILSRIDSIAAKSQLQKIIEDLSDKELEAFQYDWEGVWARDKQLIPDKDFITWLILAGRVSVKQEREPRRLKYGVRIIQGFT